MCAMHCPYYSRHVGSSSNLSSIVVHYIMGPLDHLLFALDPSLFLHLICGLACGLAPVS